MFSSLATARRHSTISNIRSIKLVGIRRDEDAKTLNNSRNRGFIDWDSRDRSELQAQECRPLQMRGKKLPSPANVSSSMMAGAYVRFQLKSDRSL